MTTRSRYGQRARIDGHVIVGQHPGTVAHGTLNSVASNQGRHRVARAAVGDAKILAVDAGEERRAQIGRQVRGAAECVAGVADRVADRLCVDGDCHAAVLIVVVGAAGEWRDLS